MSSSVVCNKKLDINEAEEAKKCVSDFLADLVTKHE